MNHQKIYENIIEKAKSENRIRNAEIYYENHHILPKCLGGNGGKDNLVFLTLREHFICHKLLTYIYPGNRKIACAYHRMAVSKRLGNLVSSRDYEYAKKLCKNIPIDEDTKKKISKMLKMTPEKRKEYKKKEKEQKKLNKWFQKNCSPDVVEKYLNSLKNTHYSPSEDTIIHVSLKNKKAFQEHNKILIEKIKDLNNNGCYVGNNFNK